MYLVISAYSSFSNNNFFLKGEGKQRLEGVKLRSPQEANLTWASLGTSAPLLAGLHHVNSPAATETDPQGPGEQSGVDGGLSEAQQPLGLRSCPVGPSVINGRWCFAVTAPEHLRRDVDGSPCRRRPSHLPPRRSLLLLLLLLLRADRHMLRECSAA
ncbi:hypothetical protein COCON_G00160160 [Conger conger]|uniref:Uncharacterized protein n=1 Tax=Conger conger TaxID=82655 RepID=A0A9Q1HUP4_CONCO|nr:hypothetical protein COCON_G00160160 [Conger conger]